MNEDILKIPVYIITGFLGSGKTTFLNKFIKSQPDKRIIVIENEVGKVNIDGAMLIESAEDIMELTAGCLCCNLNDKLYDILSGLIYRKAEFDLLVIETTGIADPAGVVETFWRNAYMERNYDINLTLCLADAKYMKQSIEITDEARRQVAFADMVLLNKIDQVEPKNVTELQQLIKAINPEVNILQGEFGNFPMAEIIGYSFKEKGQTDVKYNYLDQNYTHKHKGINTFTLTFDKPFDFKRLKHTLMLMIQINRHQIYRIKGYVDIPDMENKILIQSVYQSYRVEEGNLWGKDEKRTSKIVFIGNEVEKESIEKVFNQCLIKNSSNSQ